MIVNLKLTVLAILFVSVGFALVQGNKDTTYTPEEKAAIKKFREAVKGIIYLPYQNEDVYLIRWLRAQGLDIPGAKDMLAKSMEFRKQNKLDTITQNKELSKLEKPLPAGSYATDREGRPVLQATFGSWDMRKYMLAGSRDLLSKYVLFHYETVVTKVREAAKAGKDVSQWIFFIDMNGYSLRQHACLACIPFYLDLVTNYEAHYPNSARHIFLINTPRIFEAVLQLIRPLMSDATRRDMQVFGANKAEWQPVILSKIAPEQLSPAFGGTKSEH